MVTAERTTTGGKVITADFSDHIWNSGTPQRSPFFWRKKSPGVKLENLPEYEARLRDKAEEKKDEKEETPAEVVMQVADPQPLSIEERAAKINFKFDKRWSKERRLEELEKAEADFNAGQD